MATAGRSFRFADVRRIEELRSLLGSRAVGGRDAGTRALRGPTIQQRLRYAAVVVVALSARVIAVAEMRAAAHRGAVEP